MPRNNHKLWLLGRARHIKGNFALLAGIGALAILSSTLSKTPVLPLFAQHLGATPAEIGWIVMASTLPGILISFPAGAIADRLGTRRLLIASLLIFASAPWLYLGVTSAWQLMLVRFYHGFATAVFGTVATASIAARYTRDRATRLSTYSSATIVGRSLAPFLGGALISLASFHMVYVACAVSGTLALMLGFWLPRDAPPGPSTPHTYNGFRHSLLQVLGNRSIVITSLTEAAQYFVFGAVEAFLAVYAHHLGLDAWVIGVILGVQLVSIVLIKPLMGGLSDRAGRKPVIVGGLWTGALSVALVPLVRDPALLAALSLGFGLGFAAVTSSTTALVSDLSRQTTLGSAIGVLRTVMDIGQSAGPAVTGLLIAACGYTLAFETLAGLLLVASAGFAYGLRLAPSRPL
jgi:MFS transporter, DHA1 family, multidrug resistance protein